MPKSGQPKDPPPRREMYGFVEAVGNAIPANNRSRVSIVLDAIDAGAVERAEVAGSPDEVQSHIDDEANLALIRVSTTEKRLRELTQSEQLPEEGEWFRVHVGSPNATGLDAPEIAEHAAAPRAWIVNGLGNVPQRTSLLRLARLATDTDEARFLRKMCLGPDTRAKASEALEKYADDFLSEELKITALDVGQAACVAFFHNRRCFGYFDVGAPSPFNKKSWRRPFTHRIAERGFVLLSHWDMDHYWLVMQKPELRRLAWFAPWQVVGCRTRKLWDTLGPALTFIEGDWATPVVRLSMCRANGRRDRNSTGYAMRIDPPDAGVLLTGDADHAVLPDGFTQNVTAMMVTHHTGGVTPPPGPGGPPGVAVASYGIPNVYRHPNEERIAAHVGWRIRRTAKYGLEPRGDCDLYRSPSIRRRIERTEPVQAA